MKVLHNEKGLTLVELLAAIVLLGVIGLISFRLLTDGFSAQRIAENDISLKQETTYILSSIRENAQEDKVEICTEGNNRLFLDDIDLLTNDTTIINDISIKSLKNGKISDEIIGTSSDCLTSPMNETLEIALTISAEEGPSTYTTSTTIPGRPEPSEEYVVDIPQEEDEDNDPIGREIFTTQEEFESLDPGNISDWEWGHPAPPDYVISYNVKLDGGFDQNYRGMNRFDGHLLSLSERPYFQLNNNTVSIAENMYVMHDTTWRNNNKIEAEGNALIGGDVSMKTRSSFTAFNTYFQGDVDVPNSGGIDTAGSIRIDGTTTLRSQATIRTEGYLFVNAPVYLHNNTNSLLSTFDMYLNDGGTLNGSTVESGGSMNLSGGFELKNGAKLKSGNNLFISGNLDLHTHSSLASTGNTTISGSFKLKNGATAIIGHDLSISGNLDLQTHSSLASKGDIIISGSVDGKGTICAEGKVTVSGSTDKNLTIQEYEQNCY